MPTGLLAIVDALVLDIEGTTTPVDFVFGVLFPYVRDRVHTFLQDHEQDPAVQADLEQLRQEYEQETFAPGVPEWPGQTAIAAVPFIQYLIDIDRKSTGLKSLQGKIWAQGYADGALQSQVFEDVPPALTRWHQAGKRLYIYSSGSIQAQKLLFAHTQRGDLTPLLSGYFDTTTGPKKEADSYRKIAANLALPANRILFISDVVAELAAAQAAGFQVLLAKRPGNPPQPANDFPAIADFAEI